MAKKPQGKVVKGEELLTSSPQKFPPSQSLVPIVRIYKDALVLSNNTMVLAVEIHADDDILQNEADAMMFINQLSNSFKNFPYSFQIYVQPRQQNLEPLISNYIKYDKQWERRAEVCQITKDRIRAYLEAVIKLVRSYKGARVPFSQTHNLFKETTGLTLDDFNLMVGELPTYVHDVVTDVDRLVNGAFHVAADRSGMLAWVNRLEQIAKSRSADDQAVVKSLSESLPAFLDALFFNLGDASRVGQDEVDLLLVQATGVSTARLEQLDPGAGQALLKQSQTFLDGVRQIFTKAVESILKGADNSIAAIGRVRSIINDRGALLETLAFGHNQPIRRALFIIRKSIGLVGNAKLVSESALADAYTQLEMARTQIITQWNASGAKAVPTTAEDLIIATQEIYNKNVTWHIIQRGESESKGTARAISTVLTMKS